MRQRGLPTYVESDPRRAHPYIKASAGAQGHVRAKGPNIEGLDRVPQVVLRPHGDAK